MARPAGSPCGAGEYSSTSTGPKRCAAAASAAVSAGLSRTSASNPAASMPIRRSPAVRAARLAADREIRATAKPSRPKRRAIDRPRPGPAPTMAMTGTVMLPCWV